MGGKNIEMKRRHAIMIAMPYQGHLNPFVQLAIKLASKGITITFVHTEYANHQISKAHNISSTESDIFSEARTSGLDIRYTTISDGFPLDFDRVSNFVEFWEFLLHGFSSIVDEFVGNIVELSDPTSSFSYFLVADTYCSWIGPIARKYNLLSVSFWTQPATVFAINYYLDLLRLRGHYPPKDDREHTISYIPGVSPISSRDLMSHLRVAETTTMHKIHFRAYDEVKNADFILHNTVEELEPFTLSILNKQQPTYAIGPANFWTKLNVSKSMLSETDCTKWLESKPPGSVLYISFGSVVPVNKEVIQEIAQGLLTSKVNFIWAMRPHIVTSIDDDTDILPVGFVNDVKDRGLIVPWCDQFAMLSSVAVGGFMTHCGWNSILESIWCGVPMICYPCLYDQPTNRKLVVDDWRIGINLCDGASVTGDEVAEKIKKLMIGETSVGYRTEMKKFSSMLHDALGEDGSSERHLDQFLMNLEDKLQDNKRTCFGTNGKVAF